MGVLPPGQSILTEGKLEQLLCTLERDVMGDAALAGLALLANVEKREVMNPNFASTTPWRSSMLKLILVLKILCPQELQKQK